MNILSKQLVESLLRAASIVPAHWLMIGLIYYYGLRPGEVGLIRRAHVTPEGIYIIRLCRGTSRSYPLFPQIATPLNAFLAAHAGAPDETIFPFRATQVGCILQRYGAAAALPYPIGGMTLRRSIAQHLYDAGSSMVDVKRHLGLQRLF